MAVKDLTTGKPIKLILGFMFPIFLGNLFQQFYNLVDALIVGRTLGIKALAAVGATVPFVFFVISFIYASTQGFTVVTAQKFGAKEYDLVRKSLVASLFLSFILMAVLTLITTPFTYKILYLMQTPDDIINLSCDYLIILFAGIFATVFYDVSSNIIRALGDSKTPLYFLIFASFLNIFLDLLFILKFNMGIKGAAAATVVAQGISTILCMSFMFLKFPILRFKKEDLKLSKEFLMEHVRIGIPMGFQMSILTLGIIVLQYVLNSFGANAIAAFATAMIIDQTFTQPFLALGATAAVYTAQNFGAKKLSRIKDGVKIGIFFVLIISLIGIITISLFSTSLISWFMTDINQEVISLANEYLHIIVWFFVFLGSVILFRNILQGMGSVITPLASGIAELIARGGCAIAFSYYFGYSGVCYATPAAWIMGALVLFVGYKISLIKNIKKIRLGKN